LLPRVSAYERLAIRLGRRGLGDGGYPGMVCTDTNGERCGCEEKAIARATSGLVKFDININDQRMDWYRLESASLSPSAAGVSGSPESEL